MGRLELPVELPNAMASSVMFCLAFVDKSYTVDSKMSTCQKRKKNRRWKEGLSRTTLPRWKEGLSRTTLPRWKEGLFRTTFPLEHIQCCDIGIPLCAGHVSEHVLGVSISVRPLSAGILWRKLPQNLLLREQPYGVVYPRGWSVWLRCWIWRQAVRNFIEIDFWGET